MIVVKDSSVVNTTHCYTNWTPYLYLTSQCVLIYFYSLPFPRCFTSTHIDKGLANYRLSFD